MNRFLSLILSFTLLGSSLGITASTQAQEPDADSLFFDVSTDHEYRSSIKYLKDNNIVQGYEVEGATERQFKADYELNRAELTKIMIEAVYDAETIDSCLEDKELKNWVEIYFDDVLITDWFAKYVCVARENNIINGYPDGTFKPANPVNFAEAAKIIANTVDLKADGQTAEEWFKPFVEALATRDGIPVTVRSFPKIITRGEMALMIHAALEDIQDDEATQPLSELEEKDQKAVELPQINSCDALIERLELDQEQFAYPTMMRNEVMEESMMFDDMDSAGLGATSGATADRAMEAEAPTAPADDFSQTNVQVAGVDEADIIKNDGKYIYLIKGKTIRIVEAYPGDNMREIASIELDDEDFNPQEIYVDNNQMVIIGQVWRQRYYPMPLARMAEPSFGIADSRMAIWPDPGFNQNRMKVYLYDISDRSNPERQRSIEIEGNYSNSRKVGKNVYFVINQWIPYYHILEDQPADIILPRYKDSAEGNVEKPLIRCPQVQYFPRFNDRNYLIVAGLNIADLSSDFNRRVVIGSSQNIYSSKENLYVATPHYEEVRVRDENDIYYDSRQTTIVYRFGLSADEIEYQNQGSVPGNILNQFSMDEFNGHFRIATTFDGYRRDVDDYVTDNNLYILNNDTMRVTGKVEQIAPDERIKSVRFMGNRGYMVTFETVDPLFVIDLEDVNNPQILGKLKIPGWSDYLHPYDENHLLGFGREVDPNAENADRLTRDMLMGMKLSIFDVSDVSNPREIHKKVIGERGTTSELLNNHKALLFDRSKGLLAFPITITAKKAGSTDPYNNIKTVFSGGIVYDVNLNTGFTLKGQVTHFEDDSVFEDSGEYWYGEMGRMIQRMLYIGEYLYSVSPDYVRSYDLETVIPESFVKLSGPKSDDVYYLEDTIEF